MFLKMAKVVDIKNQDEVSTIVKCCLAKKFASKWDNLISDLALKAVNIVHNKDSKVFDCDIKKYAKVEKIPGGLLSECEVLDGVMFNKDIIHPQMRRKVENPRVILLDYIKKENSKQILNLQKTHDFSATLEEERKEVKALCDQLIELKPDVVVTEKETSDLATHYLQNVNVSVIRLLTKTDNNLLAKVIGAVIENRLEELQESDVGTI